VELRTALGKLWANPQRHASGRAFARGGKHITEVVGRYLFYVYDVYVYENKNNVGLLRGFCPFTTYTSEKGMCTFVC
jgi:hypothetical protein